MKKQVNIINGTYFKTVLCRNAKKDKRLCLDFKFQSEDRIERKISEKGADRCIQLDNAEHILSRRTYDLYNSGVSFVSSDLLSQKCLLFGTRSLLPVTLRTWQSLPLCTSSNYRNASALREWNLASFHPRTGSVFFLSSSPRHSELLRISGLHCCWCQSINAAEQQLNTSLPLPKNVCPW